MSRLIPPLDKPNRRTIEVLLRELLGWDCCDGHPLELASKAAGKAADEFQEHLLDNPKLKRLKLAADKARWAYDKLRDETRRDAKALRELYLAKGITKEFKAKLVNELEGPFRCLRSLSWSALRW